MIKFFKNVVFKIIMLVLLTAIIVSVFLFKPWWKQQYYKVLGMYHVSLGDDAYSKGELNKAVKYYNLGLKEYPEHSQARCNLANMYVSYEDYSSAVREYKKALEYNPKYITCRMDLAIILAEILSQYDEAIEEYQTVADTKRFPIIIPFVYNNVVSTNENHENAYYNMGLAYRGKSLYIPRDKLKDNTYLKSAVESYNKALKINKRSYDSLYNLALTHHLLGNTKDAGWNYCRAIETDPMKFEAHLNLGILLDGLGYHTEAIDEFRKAGLLIDTGDYQTLQYLNYLLSDAYKKEAIANDNKKTLYVISYEEENKSDFNFLKKIFKDKNKEKSDTESKNNKQISKELDEEEQNVIFKKGKIELKEESVYKFTSRMRTCEAKKIFKEMK